MGALPVARLTVDEYLALDRKAEIPSEYHDGEMFPIEAVSVAHSTISLGLGSLLRQHLAKSPCRAFDSPLRVRVSPSKFVIPDLMVICGKAVLTDEHQDTVTNPKVIVEILSPSTEGYDYGQKFQLYRQLASFEEYVLVAQDRPRVEIFRKSSDVRWVLRTFEGLDASIEIESLGLTLAMRDVYEDVELSAPDV
jgi:Uma2 family endonuclease